MGTHRSRVRMSSSCNPGKGQWGQRVSPPARVACVFSCLPLCSLRGLIPAPQYTHPVGQEGDPAIPTGTRNTLKGTHGCPR